MTDNEIIKALKELKRDCFKRGELYNLAEASIDLINRQKAEIERLNSLIEYILKAGTTQ